MSVIIKAKKKKTLLYKNIICLFCATFCEWAVLCRVLHTQVCSLAPLIVFNNACCLAIWGQTLRASLTLREQLTILSSFYLRKPLSNTLTRKALHYYPYSSSFSVICGSLGPVPNGTLNPRGLPLSPHFRDVMPLWLSGRSLLRACTSAGSAEVWIEGA